MSDVDQLGENVEFDIHGATTGRVDAHGKVEAIMMYELKRLEACAIDGIRAESYQAGPQRWTCVSYLEHTPIRSFVTTQHGSREEAIAKMAVLLADYLNAEVVRWN